MKFVLLNNSTFEQFREDCNCSVCGFNDFNIVWHHHGITLLPKKTVCNTWSRTCQQHGRLWWWHLVKHLTGGFLHWLVVDEAAINNLYFLPNSGVLFKGLHCLQWKCILAHGASVLFWGKIDEGGKRGGSFSPSHLFHWMRTMELPKYWKLVFACSAIPVWSESGLSVFSFIWALTDTAWQFP